jgi:hypothetical protein
MKCRSSPWKSYGKGYRGFPSLFNKYVRGKSYHVVTLAPRSEALVSYSSIRLDCNFITEVATLRCEIRDLAQVLDPAEEEL